MLLRSLAFLTLCSLLALPLAADDKTKPPAAAEAAKPDPFKVPEGTDTAVLQKFLSGLGEVSPEVQTREGVLEHLNKLDKAVAEVMSREIDPDLLRGTIQMRQEIFGLMGRFGDPEVANKQAAMVKALKADERPVIKKFLAMMEMAERVQKLPEITSEERQKLVQEIAGMALHAPQGDDQSLQEAVNFMRSTAEVLESLDDPADAIAAYQLFAKNLSSRKDPRLEGIVEQMVSTSRRLGLLGNEMAVKGKTLTGEDFDVAQWKGKVVLVDFWATWCGPCIGELPNVKAMYDAYHDKGFEVVGISLDEDRQALEGFLKQEKITWTTLFEDDAEKQGWENPIARYYGISGIPTVILINQQGKVVSLNARGPELGAELEKLLGPPAPKKKPAGEAK